MVDDLISSFLIRVAYSQDEKSRKQFDEGLKAVQGKVEDFGKKVGELPTIVHDATKKISSSLADLYYNAQQVRATERELHAFRYAAKQSGQDVDQANASYQAFVASINQYDSGIARQLKSLLHVDVDNEHPLKGYIEAADKLHDMFMRGGHDRSEAEIYAKQFNVPIGELSRDRAQFHKSFAEDLARTGAGYDKVAEGAKNFRHALNGVEEALRTIGEKADAVLFDKYGETLNKISKWIDDHQDSIIKFLQDLIDQFIEAYHDLKNLFGPALEWLTGLLQQAFAALDEFLGNKDGGVKGLRIALEALFAGAMLAGLARLGLALTAALLPVTRFLALAVAAGIFGAGIDAIYHAFVDPDKLTGPGSGRGGETSLEGVKRGRRGGVGGGDRGGTGSGLSKQNTAMALHSMDVLMKLGWTKEAAASAVGQVLTEDPNFDPNRVGDSGAANGLFQWHPDRLAAGKKWAAGQGLPWDTVDTQLKWMDEENKRRGTEAWKHVTSVAEGNRYGYKFEGYAGGVQQRRARDAQKLLDLHNRKPFANPFANMPSFETFQNAIHSIKNAPPLGTGSQSFNEFQDNRTVNSNIAVNVSGGFPVDKTNRPLDRPKMADVIRNSASYAA